MSAKQPLSLTKRLIGSAAFFILFFLGITGFALDRAFVQSQTAAQAERLFIRTFSLLSLAELEDQTLRLPRMLREERFNSPESGLIGLVLNAQRQSVWESLSSEWFTEGDWVRSQPNLNPGDEQFGQHRGFVYQRNGFVWEDSNNQDRYFEFWVLEDATPLNESIATYRQQLWGGLVAASVALLLVLSLITKWGLAPLHLLAAQLTKIRQGDADELTGRYPSELTPLTDSLNQLLSAEQGQRERYRKAMGDLAHSLKTPLAVMKTVQCDDQTTLNEQVDRMSQIVRYQLQRSVTDARQGPVLGQTCDLMAALERLGRALDKAFLEEDKVLDLPQTDRPLLLSMDNNDVLEILGNLIENAFKYGRSVISVDIDDDEKSEQVWVHIDDDGKGVAPEATAHIMQRGKRLDTLQPGQGIGLAMTLDILQSYNAAIEITTSPFGGARFSVQLPKAHH
ncbi:ATP-binding protein [Reinekea marina]|uniref:histidine kinase n=1 Tax=Reinekea marina TaxID=1310421 RepID=A0ABV7WT23_9GAMM|nr:ATP-binding protein [Reinekea marina]MDN3649198.1 ATP-binding protein [Reinekea marina]